MEIIYSTKLDEFIKISEDFYDQLDQSTTITYRNPIYNTVLELDINENCLWSDILGQVQPGECGFMPAGKIALTHLSFREPNIPTLPLNGETILQGLPILHCHRYNDKNILKEQDKLFEQFSDLIETPIKWVIESGVITSAQTINKKSSRPQKSLEKLFSQDARYRHISEIGIGLNMNLDLLSSNYLANETYGGSGKCVHFAIGTNAVDYHLDTICPDTLIETNKGNVLLPTQKIPLKRVNQTVCPCEEPSLKRTKT